MDAAATPDLVVRYLRELSADLLAAAVVGADGRTLAGPEALGAAAAQAVAASGSSARVIEARDAERLVVVARGNAHVLAAVHTRHALPGLVRHDLLTALGDLGDPVDGHVRGGAPIAPTAATGDVAQTLLSAGHAVFPAAADVSATRHRRPK
jgi:hypothetical protein